MAIDLLADDGPGIDLLADDFDSSAGNQMPATPKNALSLAKMQISLQYPGMPSWLQDAILSLTPKSPSPMLNSAARGVSAVTDTIPALAGGVLQGASMPIRGVAGLIPNEYVQRLANSPDLTSYFPQPTNAVQQAAQTGGELLGGFGGYGKLFEGLQGLSKAAMIPKGLQNAAALAGTGAIGTQGDAFDRGLGAAGALALGGAGSAAQKAGKKLPEFFKGLTAGSTPELLVDSIQQPHDRLLSTANELYGQVKNAIGNRNIKFPVKQDYLQEMQDILPKTRANKALIDKAKSGDYDAIHNLQSFLYRKGTKNLTSGDPALENQGEEILDLRNKLNDDLESHLVTEGNLDIAHALRQGKRTYKQIMDTYYAPNLRKGVGKMVQQDLRLIPKEPHKLFDQNSVPMRNFLQAHPEAQHHIENINNKEVAMGLLENILKSAGRSGAAVIGGKYIYDLLM